MRIGKVTDLIRQLICINETSLVYFPMRARAAATKIEAKAITCANV